MNDYRIAKPDDKDVASLKAGAAELLERAVQDYCVQLNKGTKSKNNNLDIEQLVQQLSLTEISSWLRKVSDSGSDIVKRFSYAKHAFELCLRMDNLDDFSESVPRWLHSCMDYGAFEDCIRYTQVTESDAWNAAISPKQHLTILFYLAKSFRNLGRFEEAKQCYRRIIKMAEALGDQTEISIGLLLIGKLYGNYLGQRSLFSCFIEEARRRLELELKHNRISEVDPMRIKRCLAICHDALGQAYRDSGDLASTVQNHFYKAYQLNWEIKRRNGVSRALCHLNLFSFSKASSPHDKEQYLNRFKEGMELLVLMPQDEKGMGVRFIQYSTMLAQMNEIEKAREYYDYGKHFVDKYSEYKMQARAAIAEYDLYKNMDIKRAVNSLKLGRAVAQQYNLIIQESEVNLRLAELLDNRVAISDVDPPALFENNRTNLGKLISEVKDTFSNLNSVDDIYPEFKYFSDEVKKGVPEKLLLDYDHTVRQLDRNMQATIRLLKKSSSS